MINLQDLLSIHLGNYCIRSSDGKVIATNLDYDHLKSKINQEYIKIEYEKLEVEKIEIMWIEDLIRDEFAKKLFRNHYNTAIS